MSIQIHTRVDALRHTARRVALAVSFAVVMTDYQGLGTPGLHTYVNRVAEGNAMLDAGRAAMRPSLQLHHYRSAF
jgi:hypothetical protein